MTVLLIPVAVVPLSACQKYIGSKRTLKLDNNLLALIVIDDKSNNQISIKLTII